MEDGLEGDGLEGDGVENPPLERHEVRLRGLCRGIGAADNRAGVVTGTALICASIPIGKDEFGRAHPDAVYAAPRPARRTVKSVRTRSRRA